MTTQTATHPETTQEAPGATTALVLGIIGMIAWIIPIIGLPIQIVGLVKGIKAMKAGKSGKATAGVVLCIIGLVLTTINAALGAYLGMTGQHPLVNQMMGTQAQ